KNAGASCGTTQAQYGYQLLSNFILQDPDGTKHPFQPDGVAAQNTPCGPPLVGLLVASDNSGWVANMNPQDLSVVFTRKDGAVLKLQPTPSLEDTNGNIFSMVNGVITDTLGRSVRTDGSYLDSQGVLRTVQVTTVPVAISTNLCQFAQYACNELVRGSADIN